MATARPEDTPAPATAVPPPARARLAGALAAAVALASGELVSALAGGGQSLVAGVANEIADRAAGGSVRWAIDAFGTADKPALIVTIVVVVLALGALAGAASVRRPWVGPVMFASFGALGAWAGVRDPLASDGWAVLAATAAVLAGIVTLRVLLRVAAGRSALPVTTTAAIEYPGEGRNSRRAFFGWAGAAGAFAATATLAARSLKDRSTVETARTTLTLPAPAVPEAAEPADQFGVDGLTPYVVPNDRFYRIDTVFVVPHVDVDRWTLDISGLVDRPYSLTMADLLALPMVERTITLSCVSNEVGGKLVGNARWLGVPLRDVLDRAGVQPGATQVVGRSVDGFTVGFPTEAVYDGRSALVAVGMNGEPLPVNHGFPARLVVAGLYGYVSATKWLRELQLTRWEDFDAYWVPRGWSKEAPIKTQSRIDVPGASRAVSPGPTPIAGVAWAPDRGISRVEVQVDDGPWQDAQLGPVLSNDTWRQWLLTWDATPGTHTIRVRATDGRGDTQTETRSRPDPDGATGWHTRTVQVGG